MHARCLFLVPILGSICWTPKTHFPNPTFTLKSQLPFRIPHSLSFSPPPFFFRYLSHFPVYSNSRSNQPTSKSLQQGKITMVIFRAAHMEYEKGCCKLVASPKMHLNMELKWATSFHQYLGSKYLILVSPIIISFLGWDLKRWFLYHKYFKINYITIHANFNENPTFQIHLVKLFFKENPRF